MNTKNLISIVIVNWNGRKWLDKCLDSLSNQTYEECEIIFVDNNSQDGSTDYVTSRFKDIIVIKSQENLGFANGCNIGIKNARGKYILLVNTDTWVEKSFIQKMYQSYHDHKCDVLGPTETQYRSPQFSNYRYTIDILGYPVLQKGREGKFFYIKGSCLFFEKDLYIQSKGFDNDFFMYFEETDWFWRLHLFGKKIYQDNTIFIYHDGVGMKKHKESYPFFLWRNQNTLQMLLKNYSSLILIFILPIYILQNMAEFFMFLLFLKPKLAFSYVEGLYYNYRKLKKTLAKRKWIQKHREVSDLEIIKLIYPGSGKLRHIME